MDDDESYPSHLFAPFGNALVQERITVDLTPDVPVVTDIRLSQELR